MATAAQRPEGPFSQTDEAVKKRIIWLMLLRLGLITALLGSTIVLNYLTHEDYSTPSSKFLLALVAVTYVSAIVYAVWYRVGRAIGLLFRVQLVVDFVFFGCLTYATGGIASGFAFLFDLWVIVSAVTLGGRSAYYFAALSVIILVALAVSMTLGIIEPLSDQWEMTITTQEVAYFFGINATALFVVAALVNSLVTRLERADVGLEVEKTRRADLVQLHADMIRSLTVGIATTGMSGEVLTINPSGLDIIGLDEDVVEGESLSRWLPDLHEQLVSGNTLRSRGRGALSRADGRSVPIEYIVSPLVSADAERRGFIVVFSDLTEVRRLESALERSRRLAALGELAASLAHEIRNPLGAVSGSFQLLVARPDLSEEEASLADIISREIRRMERLVDEVLNYARPRERQLNSVNLKEIIKEVVNAFLSGDEAFQRVVEVRIDGQLKGEVDAFQLRQVLWNLLRNAAQATEPGDHIEVSGYRDDGILVIEVKDTGIGIDEAHLARLFDPFYTTRELGLGLGLTLCRRIVEDHGGKITAGNVPDGSGSVFRIELPVKA